jgi:hypothetical protein
MFRMHRGMGYITATPLDPLALNLNRHTVRAVL